LHEDLRFHPYKIHVTHELKEQDKASRVNFCRQFLDIVNNDEGVFDNLIMSDASHFRLSGNVNKQNFRYWSNNKPMQLYEKPLHSENVTVWYGVSTFVVIRPYFFEEKKEAVTVDSERYCTKLQTFLATEQRRMRNVWFQQDGVTAHTARQSMTFLRGMFPGRLISLFGDIPWPARSPDLTDPDFFLWGYLKSKVYATRPHSIQELHYGGNWNN
jgi:hypothetical protein